MLNLVNRLWKDEEGQDLVEYGLLLLLVALVAVTSMKVISGAISNIFSSAAANLTSAAT
jgi:pilus assembly protein Flp/PilA